MNYILETKRLALREFTFDDTPFIIQLLNSEGWLRFIGDRNVKTEEAARVYLQNGPMRSYRDNGFGLSMVERVEDKLAIGMCGLIRRDTLDFPDIGFSFLPAFTGTGYAFEIADAVLADAKTRLHIDKVCAITSRDNFSSIKLLEKLNMRFIKKIAFGPAKEELLLFQN